MLRLLRCHPRARGAFGRHTCSKKRSTQNNKHDKTKCYTGQRRHGIEMMTIQSEHNRQPHVNLEVRGETIDGADQIIRKHGVENPMIQKFLVSPVADYDFIRCFHRKPDLCVPTEKPHKETEDEARAIGGHQGLLFSANKSWREGGAEGGGGSCALRPDACVLS